MENYNSDFKKGLILSAGAGMIWGILIIILNSITGIFVFENGFIYNIPIFISGGGTLGVVLGGFMITLRHKLPYNSFYTKFIILSTSLWIILRIGGFLLSISFQQRYHPVMSQTIQGFFLAVILGGTLGYMWEKYNKS